ncbi:MAG TPA: type II secretion system F family protein [Bacillota bacterium]|nr:type II secretion system F family protein [Bacillota bacterium]
MNVILYPFVFIGFTFLFGLVGTKLMNRKKTLEQRLQRYLPQGIIASQDIILEEPRVPLYRKIFLWASSQLAGRPFLGKWEQRLEQAGISLKPEEFMTLCLLLSLMVGFLFAILGLPVFSLALVLMIGYFGPNMALQSRRTKRLQRCAAQLPAALSSMATSLRAGFSFLQALQMLSKELPDPLGPELARTLRELSLGMSLEEALKRLIERLPNDDLELVVLALLIQRSTGGNLAEILETIQETVQERIRIQEEIRTLTAQGRASAWVITLLPLILVALFSLLDHQFFDPLLHTKLGWGLIGYGVVSGFIGWILMKKLIRVEV